MQDLRGSTGVQRYAENNRRAKQSALSKKRMADLKPSAGLFSRHEAIGRRQQDPTEVDLNSTDLLRKEEEADRQYLIEEVTQELRPQHPLLLSQCI